MRSRRKKNLEKRLEACQSLLLFEWEKELDFRADAPARLDLAELFGNDRPVRLEIGCGKGGFITELASRMPDTNFLAVEKVDNVIVSACEKVMAAGLTNVRFLPICAEYLPRWIPDRSCERIYLNFSCPYPKKRYTSHRLTSPRFLPIYRRLLTGDGYIEQKTDNQQLFEYSIEQFSQAGFALRNVSLDLHHSNFEGNIITEYEQRFLSLGKPIYRLEAYLPE